MSKTMTKTKLATPASKPSPKSANKAANIQTARHMDVRNVPLASLTLDPGNVRKSRVADHATVALWIPTAYILPDNPSPFSY